MYKTPIDPQEAKWRRQSDARVLAEAEQIKADKNRYNSAILGAKEIAQEEITRVRGIVKVAKMKTPTAPKCEVPEHNEQKTFRGYNNPACIGKL